MQGTPDYYEMINIGFGPAGIALACALEEAPHRPLETGQCLFLEKHSNCAWHPEFLLDGTDINHHLLRDLVTPRNPQSRHSFAMYLKEHGRLYQFGLLGRPASRNEWSDYVSWVGQAFAAHVHYEEEVREIRPVMEDGEITLLRVMTSKGQYLTRNLVLSSGSTPNIPRQFAQLDSARIIHTSRYLSSLEHLDRQGAWSFAVIGSGQSAGESIVDLLNRFPNAQVTSIHRSSGFKIAQLGQFPNQAFHPERVAYFHKLGQAEKAMILEEVKSTNYSGIDVDESQALYSLFYEGLVSNKPRLALKIFTQVESASPTEAGVTLDLCDPYTQEHSSLDADYVILGTGYQQDYIPSLLSQLQPWLSLGSDNGVRVEQNYKLTTTASFQPAIFVNGLSERSHGIGEGQSFSLLAMRAGILTHSLF
ncbi:MULTISPECIES: SidA/IucD/PvdA family monooxygenase [Pseudomonas]|uniref:SidA/IucD/PvdA family monooxygenase n=1 Tax=Pseudomonas TaxID=286 RepID=UPI0005B486F1|nr:MULTISPECIES: SidA/IucD/PvdA family monooxygenase [Pseudomonas]BBP65619.1 L-lysine 6-monooxygenase [Pseudomonas sp. Cab53]